MANPATLADLKARALDYADVTDAGFAVTARLVNYINMDLATLHNMLANSWQDYKRSSDTVTLVAGTEEYALPSDYLKTLKVWYVSGSRRYRVPKFSLDEVDGYKTSPSSAGTVHHWYVPQLTALSADEDVVDSAIPIGWEDYACLGPAIRIKARSEEDPSVLMSLRDRLVAEIRDSIQPRDGGDNYAVADYYNRWNRSVFDLHPEERNLKYRVMGTKLHIIETEYLGV